jgi:hypothetical protein
MTDASSSDSEYWVHGLFSEVPRCSALAVQNTRPLIHSRLSGKNLKSSIMIHKPDSSVLLQPENTMTMLSTNECDEVPIKDTVASEQVDDLVKRLSDDEIEGAARSSFAYTKDTLHQNGLFYAKQMAKRYLESACQEKGKALRKMKATIKFRREKDINGLREAINDPVSDYHVQLKKSLASGHLYVQGYDRDGRATYVFVPRLVTSHDPTWEIRTHIWTLERAIACSRAKDKTVNAVVDFNGFSTLLHAPPASIGKEIMTTLRNHYVGHINQIFLIDAPTAFLCLWAVFKPFAGRMTRDKIQFVSSKEQKQQVLGQWYDAEQAPSWMLPSGKKNRELNLEEYLHETPFDRAFDEI